MASEMAERNPDVQVASAEPSSPPRWCDRQLVAEVGDVFYRVQAADGRGPYRPGMSHFWTDSDHAARNPTFMDEFGLGIIDQMSTRTANGCAFRTLEQAARWFSPAELRRLERLGYYLARLTADTVVAESERQVIISRRAPFSIKHLRLPLSTILEHEARAGDAPPPHAQPASQEPTP